MLGIVLSSSYRSMNPGSRTLFAKRGEGTCFSRPMSIRAFSRQISSLFLSTHQRRKPVSALGSPQISGKHLRFLSFYDSLPSFLLLSSHVLRPAVSFS